MLIAKLAASSKTVGEVRDVTKCNEIMSVLGKPQSWGLDIFALQDVCGKPLSLVGHELIEVRLQLCAGDEKVEGLDSRTLRKFLQAVEAGYPANPYHNALHAADAALSLFFFLGVGGGTKALQVHNIKSRNQIQIQTFFHNRFHLICLALPVIFLPVCLSVCLRRRLP